MDYILGMITGFTYDYCMDMTEFNTQQRSAVEYPPEPLLILAGAGTGKTTTIVGRMAYLIQERKVDPDSILTLTFTNDAASHLK